MASVYSLGNMIIEGGIPHHHHNMEISCRSPDNFHIVGDDGGKRKMTSFAYSFLSWKLKVGRPLVKMEVLSAVSPISCA